MARNDRQEFIRVRVSRDEKRAVEAQAEARGMTISEFMRTCVTQATKQSDSEFIVTKQTELLIQVGLIQSKMLDKLFNQDEAKDIRERAREKASKMLLQLLESQA